MATNRVKVTVSLTTDHVRALRKIAAARACTVSEVLRHAIHLGEALYNATESGARIMVEHPTEGDVLVIMPPLIKRKG